MRAESFKQNFKQMTCFQIILTKLVFKEQITLFLIARNAVSRTK